VGEADGPDENPISALFPRPSGSGEIDFVFGSGPGIRPPPYSPDLRGWEKSILFWGSDWIERSYLSTKHTGMPESIRLRNA